MSTLSDACTRKHNHNRYSCAVPDGAVDVFAANANGSGVTLVRTAKLTTPRGWVCAAAAGGNRSVVVLAGGGTSGVTPHSAEGDVIDLSSGEATHYSNALSVGRWGISCTAAGGGKHEDATYFLGGKV
jgi:hypothetical protein